MNMARPILVNVITLLVGITGAVLWVVFADPVSKSFAWPVAICSVPLAGVAFDRAVFGDYRKRTK